MNQHLQLNKFISKTCIVPFTFNILLVLKYNLGTSHTNYNSVYYTLLNQNIIESIVSKRVLGNIDGVAEIDLYESVRLKISMVVWQI